MSVEEPLDRAVLTAFVELVKQSEDGPVAEVGCGWGRVTAHLAASLWASLAWTCRRTWVGRSARPDLAFAVAQAGALPLRSGASAGLVAWYSLINLPSELLPEVLGEFVRVMRPGGPVVVAFQSGEGDRVDRATSYGHPVPLTYYRHRVEDVADVLAGAGFVLQATVRRAPSLPHETTPQSFLLAMRR